MKAATRARLSDRNTRLMILTERFQSIEHRRVGSIVDYFEPGDLLVINRSATLPSSFRGIIRRISETIEIRLAAFQGPNSRDLRRWKAVSFGAGTWKTPTEKRGRAPILFVGDEIRFGDDLSAKIISVESERLLTIEFNSPNSPDSIVHALYRHGRPIQYSYLEDGLETWDQQTLFAGPPVSVEPPSAGFPFNWDLILRLRAKGVEIGTLLHSAGLSSTGSIELDTMLPLAEWYEIPETTVKKFEVAKKEGRQIVALGTTVLRALESAWDGTTVRAGARTTTLKISPEHVVQTVSGIVTGMHEVGASHMQILKVFSSPEFLQRGYREAELRNYEGHEYGDITLLRNVR